LKQNDLILGWPYTINEIPVAVLPLYDIWMGTEVKYSVGVASRHTSAAPASSLTSTSVSCGEMERPFKRGKIGMNE